MWEWQDRPLLAIQRRLAVAVWRLPKSESDPRASGTAPVLRTWLGGMLEVKYVLGSQEAISEAGRLGGCRL